MSAVWYSVMLSAGLLDPLFPEQAPAPPGIYEAATRKATL